MTRNHTYNTAPEYSESQSMIISNLFPKSNVYEIDFRNRLCDIRMQNYLHLSTRLKVKSAIMIVTNPKPSIHTRSSNEHCHTVVCFMFQIVTAAECQATSSWEFERSASAFLTSKTASYFANYLQLYNLVSTIYSRAFHLERQSFAAYAFGVQRIRSRILS
jgi:hypothetical protein